MEVDLLIHSASQILTLTGDPQRGSDLGKLGLIEDGAVAIGDEKILAVGSSAELRSAYQAEMEIDATNRVVLPGLVDPHTHLIWAGDRAAEFEMRVAGATYTEIMDAGGGIISTVHQTRAASVDALITQAQPRLRRMLAHGTTTAEVKTGYGLDTQTELRMLETILRLDKRGPMELAPTFLGAHAIPIEYSDRPDEYTNLVCDEMLPAVKEWWQQNAAGC
ncbi:MAG: amidohydrolase family protein, partial [Anaerolineales bacterium]|nr:amidohydrolase family protein [Anaerolineales bacterium]